MFPYTKCNPSPDTFKRLFATLKTDFMEKAVIKQGHRILDILGEKQIAINGKKLCGPAPREKVQKGDYLLNVYVAGISILIGQKFLITMDFDAFALKIIVSMSKLSIFIRIFALQ